MTDLLSVSAILSLAFQFANSEPSKAALNKVSEVTTEAVLKNLGKLRQMIWEKLQHQPTAAAALSEAEAGGSKEALQTVEPDLQIAMRDDPAFAAEVRSLATQVLQDINIDQRDGRNIMNVLGGTGQQFNNENINAAVQQGTITNNNYYGTPNS
jgi:hypothetical protein